MRMTGHILLWLGFLSAAFVSTRQLESVDWVQYIPCAVVGVVGIVLLRRTAGAAAREDHTVRTNLATLEASVARLVERVARINAELDTIDVYSVHGRLDEELLDDLVAFVDARESMVHGLGLEQYAQIMDSFARGERSLNRAWSASADGYIDEVRDCLARAERALRDADGQLRGHLVGVGGAPA